MDREQFFAKLAALDEERLKKALWNLYRRGSATMRERIEGEIDPAERASRARAGKEPPTPSWVLGEVQEFVSLARSGAYLAGDRRVTPKQRTRWRFEFQRLVADAQSALHAEDVTTAASALEELIDLACATRDYDYFRSEDPIEAARLVVSDAVALLWGRVRDRYGFAAFAERAAPQLVRWESEYGWTRSGMGRVSEKEMSLAGVLARMLVATDMWITFTDCYLDALDHLAHEGAKPRRSWVPVDRTRERRTANLAEWHLVLLDRLELTEGEGRLDRLVGHPALGGPELTILRARLAHQREDRQIANEHRTVAR